ncbi:MAG: hypothetical protein NTX50_18115, partial [Candidatus Sumerlaeota bacterium]|nr:hypothetical protein [Candidatus Sumerlaeota bacterium]
MSAVAILIPLVHARWPQLAEAIVAAAASAGFNVEEAESAMAKGKSKRRSYELDLENVDVVAGSMSRDDRIVVEREGARVIFSRDGRGQFKVCVEG